MGIGRHPCGFCSTGDHDLCRIEVRNGSAAPSGPVWKCPCAIAGHTLGRQPPLNKTVIRLSAASREAIRLSSLSRTAPLTRA